VIIGASGFIGKATVLSLAQAVGGDRIVVATRNPEGPGSDAFKSVGASVVKGDLNHPDALKDVFTGASSVFIIAPGTEVCHERKSWGRWWISFASRRYRASAGPTFPCFVYIIPFL
jgi:uncharacterized protein YbjT (DUF2867 family)